MKSIGYGYFEKKPMTGEDLLVYALILHREVIKEINPLDLPAKDNAWVNLTRDRQSTPLTRIFYELRGIEVPADFYEGDANQVREYSQFKNQGGRQ